MPGTKAAGHCHPHPSSGGRAPISPRRTFWGLHMSASPHISSVGKPSQRPNGVCLVCASWIYLSSFNCTLRMFKFWLGQNGAQNDQHRDFALEKLKISQVQEKEGQVPREIKGCTGERRKDFLSVHSLGHCQCLEQCLAYGGCSISMYPVNECMSE